LILNREFIKQFILGSFISERRVKKFLTIPNLKAIVFECQETLSRYIPDGADKEKIFVIPPPLPKDFLNILSEVKCEKDIYKKKYSKVLYFGPPISLRGIDNLIHAISIVSKKIDNVRLDILSRIEYEGLLKHERKVYELIKKKGLESNVNIISGLLSSREIVEHMLSSDVVCLPFKCVVSDVPIAVLETLATGVPLITTDVAGVSEFAKNGNCTVIQPGDHEALADAIIRVLRSNTQKVTQSTIEGILNNLDF